ncbi:Frizzled/smoothened-like sans CRD protein B [Ceratocystis lukuohia]|uniref:Frizzled/smoothened-like sans CRD protein B n=1 Tax=Ceratocystis lukuohia TaxID=2019550 RepID=A0ABR4MAK7_9PEZI
MSSDLDLLRGGCQAPFFNQASFSDDDGFIPGRLCIPSNAANSTCCLPCPLVDWVYPDSFHTMASVADWISVVGFICCVFLLISWAALPVEKTHRHYLSICLTIAVAVMSLGFVVPLAADPEQCINEITPNDMSTSSVCAVSGTMIMLGGFAGATWVFLRALSLHLQICWQVVVGRNFMLIAQAIGWLIPTLIVAVSLKYSGVSFRFGQTCHVNHDNSMADFWIPMLVFSGFTLVLQGATFVYCIKVYLASLNDSSSTTENSTNLPTHSVIGSSNISPRQAYRRVKRVVQLQWRGITIVLIILMDVIFFSVVFVYQDRTIEDVRKHPEKATAWVSCLLRNSGDKGQCIDEASGLAVQLSTIVTVLILLAINGIWLLLFLGNWGMLMGWVDLANGLLGRKPEPIEFVSKDATLQSKSYELLSRETNSVAATSMIGSPNPMRPAPTVSPPVNFSRGPYSGMDSKSPISPLPDSPMSDGARSSTFRASAGFASYPPPINTAEDYSNGAVGIAAVQSVAGSPVEDGRRTPDYFGSTARYYAPNRSFSSPHAPRAGSVSLPPPLPAQSGVARLDQQNDDHAINPLGMNRI